ncbi:MAG: phosphoglycerate kinase [Pseudomonadota bacterium]|jgi:phosphoglycerate kinase|nr:phosphoglycerate kinase [Pseudomonadota bacterium]|tara:strand:+ start:2502 stop:3704 length:1203 start_codon:yes stop_codon:yes gene_type:complete
MIKIKNLDDLLENNLKGKTVYLRADLNLPTINGKVTDTTRIKSILPTIRELKKNKCKIVILSHFGRPKGSYNKKMSLKHIIPKVEKVTRSKIYFSKDHSGINFEKLIKKIPDGSVVIMENTRFHKGEEKNFKYFAKDLAKNCDFFVNDAFSVAHRSHASVTGLTNYVPSFSGRSLEKEVITVSKFLSSKNKKKLAIIGGAKISTKINLINNLLKNVNAIVIGGAMANTFLLAQGKKIGKSLSEKTMIKTAKKIMSNASRKKCKIILPVDAVVASNLKKGGKFSEYNIDNIPDDGLILDIGKNSISIIDDEISKTKEVLWCGPLGLFEQSPFHVGTASVAKTLSKMTKNGKIVSVAGGGDTVAAISQSNYVNDFTYISTAGGAFLEMIAGQKLPGIEVLKK